MTIKIYRKPTHTGHYLNSELNHPPHIKQGIVQSFYHMQRMQNLLKEIDNLRYDLHLNGYPQRFINSAPIQEKLSSRKKMIQPLGLELIPYVKGILEKYKRTGNLYIIRTVLKTNTLLGIQR
jgi:hypothetical protein